MWSESCQEITLYFKRHKAHGELNKPPPPLHPGVPEEGCSYWLLSQKLGNREEDTGERLGESVKSPLFPIMEGQERVSLSVCLCSVCVFLGVGKTPQEEKVVNDRVSRCQRGTSQFSVFQC